MQPNNDERRVVPKSPTTSFHHFSTPQWQSQQPPQPTRSQLKGKDGHCLTYAATCRSRHCQAQPSSQLAQLSTTRAICSSLGLQSSLWARRSAYSRPASAKAAPASSAVIAVEESTDLNRQIIQLVSNYTSSNVRLKIAAINCSSHSSRQERPRRQVTTLATGSQSTSG